MKKIFTTKIKIISIIVTFIIAISVIITINVLEDKDKLTIEEKEWITQNISNVQNVYIPSNSEIFSKNGKGVLIDLINDFKEKYNLDVNPIIYNNADEVNENVYKYVITPDENDIVLFKEHYVVLSNSNESFNNIKQIENKRIGLLKADENNLSFIINTSNINYYDDIDTLFNELDSKENIDYIIVPLEETLRTILSKEYYVNFHISDINKYLIYRNSQSSVFSSILKKYTHKWTNDLLEYSYNENKLLLFKEALNISDKDLDEIQARSYKYGFVPISPYEVLTGGKYGGIVNEYLSEFSKFSKTEFTSTKYNSFNKFAQAINNNSINIFYNYYNLNVNYKKINSLHNVSFDIIAKQNNDLIVNTIYSLKNKTVYVLKNSILEQYLNTIGNIHVKTYQNERELKKIIRKEKIVAIDSTSYDYYKENILNGYYSRYHNTLTETYNFYTNNNQTFNLLLNKFILTLDPKVITNHGIESYSVTIKAGKILSKISKYFLIIVLISLVIIFILYKSTKKVKISKKIKKEDKMKYIDQLTSLKNRNYLNENIANWNKNTIYPQATIIIDLNQVQVINDTLGYEQGDSQIKAAANILIKTQLDNSDIMRTDGNEFLIYLVNYQEKQIISYIRKLYKEFKTLPYPYGAAIGYSMIKSDTKTIEDSINESVEDMKNKKEEVEEK